MTRIFYDAGVVFLSVLVGLAALWTILRILPPGLRLAYDADAGSVSALASLIILSVASA